MTPNVSSSSAGTATAGVVTHAHSVLRAIYATNGNASQRWLLLYNLSRTPVSGDVPKNAFLLYSALNGPSEKALGAETFGDAGTRGYDDGLAWAVSGSMTNYDGTAIATDHAIMVIGAGI